MDETENREIISHIRESDMAVQLNDDHQLGVATMAESFAAEFGMGDYARIMSLLHDKGKEQLEWQKYIRQVTGYNKDYSGINKGPNHAFVGACVARKCYPEIAPLIAQPIAGHHRGLYDYCQYEEETNRPIPDGVCIGEPTPYSLPDIKRRPKDLHHTVRMLFSCLVDADSLDTERFMNPRQASLRGGSASIDELLNTLESHLLHLRNNSRDTQVNQVRNFVQEQCVKESNGEKGFYSLTVPTGGGKTLASVLWALHHANRNRMKRIIIVIPYTSIIAQTASTLKKIFGEDNVLEHHSNVNSEGIGDEKLRRRMELATENWDYPIIVTTNVQFFESLFSNRRSDCRKLHNIANSVVIFDEVQTLPLAYYKPIVDTLDTLHRIFGVSILFTTASQPVLTGRIEGANPRASFDALTAVREIIPKEAGLHLKLRRVELDFIKGILTYDEIVSEITQHSRVLCIVNTRKDAKELFDRLPKEGICLHLSRMMCSAHIAATIKKIKEALNENGDYPIRVIATQLIEAGVDIDFPVVYRQEAGLDSILQAAGRCNREGKLKLCCTRVFSLGKENPLPPGLMTQMNNARLGMGHHQDWFSPEAMTDYFKQLYSRIDDFDKKQMSQLLYKRECEFEEAAHQFHLIDERTISVIINWGDSMKHYQQLKATGPSYSIMKKLAQYSVNIREHDFNALRGIGAIEELYEKVYAIPAPSFYSEETGLAMRNQWLEETYII